MIKNTCPQCGKDIGAETICSHCQHKRQSADERSAKKSFFSLILLIFFLWSIIISALIFGPELFQPKNIAGKFTACQSNLISIGTALEKYAADHNGHYPKTLADLIPTYIQEIPTCKICGRDSYSSSYVSSVNAYTYYCKGKNHIQLTEINYPQYNSYQGVVTRP